MIIFSYADCIYEMFDIVLYLSPLRKKLTGGWFDDDYKSRDNLVEEGKNNNYIKDNTPPEIWVGIVYKVMCLHYI